MFSDYGCSKCSLLGCRGMSLICMAVLMLVSGWLAAAEKPMTPELREMIGRSIDASRSMSFQSRVKSGRDTIDIYRLGDAGGASERRDYWMPDAPVKEMIFLTSFSIFLTLKKQSCFRFQKLSRCLSQAMKLTSE